MENKIKVAISHGDINGIGYEVLIKTFYNEDILELFTPVIYGSARAAFYWKQKLQMEHTPQWCQIKSAKEAKDKQINIINCVNEEDEVEIGKATVSSGRSSFLALDMATKDVRSGLCDVLVTAPISKHNMPKDTFPYKGHTDYLEATDTSSKTKSLMILTADNLRVALATVHCSLSEVSQLITKDLIIERIKTFDQSLKRDFGIIKPRIAILGLNPHAGDNGLIGREEIDVIKPAMSMLDEEGYLLFGPYPADGFFGSDTMEKFDGVLAMYHDQGLAPFKALYMNRGVNYSAGIDIIRTSPDHGTGFDIAGTGVANCESMRNAIYLAIDTFRLRQQYDEITRNPLKRMYVTDRFEKQIDLTTLEED